MWLQERVAMAPAAPIHPFISQASRLVSPQPSKHAVNRVQQGVKVMTTMWITSASYNCHMRYMYIVHHLADVWVADAARQ